MPQPVTLEGHEVRRPTRLVQPIGTGLQWRDGRCRGRDAIVPCSPTGSCRSFSVARSGTMIATLLAFAVASTLLILAPGPDSLLVMRNTLRNGRRAGWVTASGTLSGLLVWAVAAALGLSALLRVSHLGYDILRFVGASYLIWLGVSSLRLSLRKHASPGTIAKSGEPADATVSGAGWGRVYLNGLLSNLFNPKIGVFFISFLPGFIPAGASPTMFSLAFGLWFIAETGAWLATLAWMVAHCVVWLQGSTVQRWLERATGIVLIGFGLRLATETQAVTPLRRLVVPCLQYGSGSCIMQSCPLQSRSGTYRTRRATNWRPAPP